MKDTLCNILYISMVIDILGIGLCFLFTLIDLSKGVPEEIAWHKHIDHITLLGLAGIFIIIDLIIFS